MQERGPHYGQEDYDYYRNRPSDLKILGDLDDWQVVEGEPDIRGWNVVDKDGDNVGTVDDLLVSTEAGEAIFAVVGYGGTLGLGGRKTLIPLDRLDIDADNDRMIFRGAVEDVRNAPGYTHDTRDYGGFYDYWTGRREAAAPMEEKRTTEAEGRMVIPEVEEHMEVGKRTEQVGEVEIRKEVETHPETVREKVRKTRVRVHRRGVEPREVRPGEHVLREGETIEIPIVEEKLVAEKRAEVTGEVVIEPETIEEEETVTKEVRREHVEVEGYTEEMEEEEEEEAARRRLE